MNPVIHTCSSALQAAQQAGALLSQKLTFPGPIFLLLSGGTSLNILEYVQTEHLNGRVTISVLDERLSSDPNANNFAQLSKTDFFKRAIAQEAHFERKLRTWEKGHIIITQGIGPDGHTAGIFPYPEDPEKFKGLFDNPDHWVVGYEATGKNPYPQRVTVTLPFLRQVDVSIVYVCGEEKKQALTKTLAPEGSLAETPARIIHEMKQVEVFTDVEFSEIEA